MRALRVVLMLVAFGGLAAGKGREQVFAYCGACHSLRLVLQQRLSRDTWDDTLVYMVEEQVMPEIDPPDRKLVLDYLGKYLGRDVPRAIP